MKRALGYALWFLLVSAPIRGFAVWSAEEGILAFGELVELSDGNDSLYDAEEALLVLADIYGEMDVGDFNQVVTFLLGVYQQEPSSRLLIHHLLNGTSHRLAEELDEQESDHLLWGSSSGAMNGAFLLAVANMGVRLARVGVFKGAADKLKGFSIGGGGADGGGKGMGDSRSLVLRKKLRFADSFGSLKKWNKIHLNRAWKQYAAAALGGGILGVGIFYGNRLSRRIHPGKSLLAINGLFLVEAVAFVAHRDSHSSSGREDESAWSDEAARHIDALNFLMNAEKRFESGVSVEDIREGLAMLEKMGFLDVPDSLKEELPLLFPESGGMIYPEAVLYRLRSLTK